MNGCEGCRGLGAGAFARTMTTIAVALASVVVLALAGCANARGIDSSATVAARRLRSMNSAAHCAWVMPFGSSRRSAACATDINARFISQPTLSSAQ